MGTLFIDYVVPIALRGPDLAIARVDSPCRSSRKEATSTFGFEKDSRQFRIVFPMPYL